MVVVCVWCAGDETQSQANELVQPTSIPKAKCETSPLVQGFSEGDLGEERGFFCPRDQWEILEELCSKDGSELLL